MLYLTFQEPTDKQKLILYPGDIFDYISEDEWFYDEEVKNIIKVIDKSTLINENMVNSEVLGIIPISKISGGAKSLILLLKWEEANDYIFCSHSFGDNCYPYIYELSEKKDIFLYVTSFFDYPISDTFKAMCLDNGKMYIGKYDIASMILKGNAGVLT